MKADDEAEAAIVSVNHHVTLKAAGDSCTDLDGGYNYGQYPAADSKVAVEITGFQTNGGVKMMFYYKDENNITTYPGALQPGALESAQG